MLESMIIFLCIYFLLSFAIIIDTETNSHCINKRKVYYILAIKSCILPNIIGTLISLLILFLSFNLGYVYYTILYLPIFILVPHLSYCIYDYYYPKDSESTTHK